MGIWWRDKWIIKKISCSLKYLSSLTTIFSHLHIETTTSSSKQRFLDSLSVKSPNKHLSQEHPYNRITLNLPLRMFKDLVWGDYISTWPPEDERITEIMARVAIFIGVLSAPIPPRSISSLTVTIADPGEIQQQMFPQSRKSTIEMESWIMLKKLKMSLSISDPRSTTDMKRSSILNIFVKFVKFPLWKCASVSPMWQWYPPLVTTVPVSSWCVPISQAAPSTSLGPCRPFIKRSELSSILSFLHILSVQRSETFYGREIRHKLNRPAKPRYLCTDCDSKHRCSAYLPVTYKLNCLSRGDNCLGSLRANPLVGVEFHSVFLGYQCLLRSVFIPVIQSHIQWMQYISVSNWWILLCTTHSDPNYWAQQWGEGVFSKR